MPNPAVVVVINEVGGTVAALRDNAMNAVVDNVSGCQQRSDVALESNDGEVVMRMVAEEIFVPAKRLGFRTVLTGVPCLPPHPSVGASDATTSMPEADTRLMDWGIELATSMSDDFPYAAHTHDKGALEELSLVIDDHLKNEHDQRPLLVWANLLSCRDVERARFQRTKTEGTFFTYAASPSSKIDERSVPASIGLAPCLPLVPATEEGATAVSKPQYATLLGLAQELVERNNRLIGAELQRAIAICPELKFVHTATKSIGIGEYGASQGTVSAHATNCVTFISSNAAPNACTLPFVCLTDVLREVCLDQREYTRSCVKITTECRGGQRRVSCILNDRAYICIGTTTELVAVFDRFGDAYEEQNVLETLPHLTQDLEAAFGASVRAVPTAVEESLSPTMSGISLVSTRGDQEALFVSPRALDESPHLETRPSAEVSSHSFVFPAPPRAPTLQPEGMLPPPQPPQAPMTAVSERFEAVPRGSMGQSEPVMSKASGSTSNLAAATAAATAAELSALRKPVRAASMPTIPKAPAKARPLRQREQHIAKLHR